MENQISDGTIRSQNLGTKMNTDLDQCSGCAKWFKKRGGLNIHRAKTDCGEQLSGSHRNKSKSEATSIQDTNHSDASGRVRLNTTRRGNGAQRMEAMVKETKDLQEKMAGDVDAKGKVRQVKNLEEREEKTDIRNWLKKKERVDKEHIHQMKHEEVEVVDLEDFDAPISDFIK